MKEQLILAVDRNQRNLELLANFLGRAGYRTLGISSMAALDLILLETLDLGLALVDISGFDHSIWEHCRHLSERGIPLLVISPRDSVAIRQEGLSSGARSVMTKPLVAKELIQMVKGLLTE